jgi:hypothetical protein
VNTGQTKTRDIFEELPVEASHAVPWNVRSMEDEVAIHGKLMWGDQSQDGITESDTRLPPTRT